MYDCIVVKKLSNIYGSQDIVGSRIKANYVKFIVKSLIKLYHNNLGNSPASLKRSHLLLLVDKLVSLFACWQSG